MKFHPKTIAVLYSRQGVIKFRFPLKVPAPPDKDFLDMFRRSPGFWRLFCNGRFAVGTRRQGAKTENRDRIEVYNSSHDERCCMYLQEVRYVVIAMFVKLFIKLTEDQ